MDEVSARAKRRWLLRWWTAQAAALYLLPPVLPLLAGDKNYRIEKSVGALVDDEYATWMLGIIATVAFLQWVYLRPVRPPVPGRRPVRLAWSVLIGSMCVSALLAAAVLAGLGVRHDVLGKPSYGDGIGWALLGVFAINWLLAMPLLFAFSSRTASHEEFLARVATWLFAGTVVEVLAVLPFDYIARRKEDCWCGRGSFVAVVVGTAMGAILLGPTVFLVLLRRRRTRWPEGRCVACGAGVGEALIVKRCPSCGAGWAE